MLRSRRPYRYARVHAARMNRIRSVSKRERAGLEPRRCALLYARRAAPFRDRRADKRRGVSFAELDRKTS